MAGAVGRSGSRWWLAAAAERSTLLDSALPIVFLKAPTYDFYDLIRVPGWRRGR